MGCEVFEAPVDVVEIKVENVNVLITKRATVKLGRS